jgi:hypothetical protein
VAEYLSAALAMWREPVSEPAAHRRGEEIAVVHHVHGRLADGTAHDVTVADVHTVTDVQVVRMLAYADPAQVPDCPRGRDGHAAGEGRRTRRAAFLAGTRRR